MADDGAAGSGMRFPRVKPRNLLASLFYRIDRLLPLSRQRRAKLYLDLGWIFQRFGFEHAHGLYPAGAFPVRRSAFLLEAIQPGERVLDLGCANGEITGLIAARGADVVGIDQVPALIDQARRANPGVQFEQGEARAYIANAPRFDVLVLSHCLEHLDDPAGFLRGFSGQFGRIYIEVPDFEASHLNQIRIDQKCDLLYMDSDHVSEFTRDELKALCREAGLSVEAEEYRFGVIRLWCRG